MSKEVYECPTQWLAEAFFSEAQEIYSHVEFLNWDGKLLTLAFIP